MGSAIAISYDYEIWLGMISGLLGFFHRVLA